MSDDLYIILNIAGSKVKYFISELDTIETIKIRLAANQGVNPLNKQEEKIPSLLPSLVILQEKIEEKTSKIVNDCRAIHYSSNTINQLHNREFTIIDFVRYSIAGISKAGIDINKQRDFAEQCIQFFEIQDMRTYFVYLYVFVLANYKLGMTIETGIKTFIEEEIGYGSFEIDLNINKKSIQEQVENNIKDTWKESKLFQDYKENLKVLEEITSTDIEYTRTTLLIKFKIKNDIFELFNGLKLSTFVPFAFVDKFYKTLKTFKPHKSWAVELEDSNWLVLFVLNRRIEPEKNKLKTNPKNYSFVIIRPVGLDDDFNTLVEMEITSKIDDELKEENLMERIFNAFPTKVTECTYEQKGIQGTYMIPWTESFYIPLFHDMVMNDPLISQLLVIDESPQTLRIRGGIFTYFRYNSKVNYKNFMSCNIDVHMTETRHQIKYPEYFRGKVGQSHISIKMSAPNEIEAKKFKRILNQIIQYYLDPEYIDNLKIPYELLLSNADTLLSDVVKGKGKVDRMRKRMLKDIDPDMFIPGYQRFCQVQPSILESQEEIQKAMDQKQDIMFFPKEDPQAYICKDHKFKYVGLKINSLKNRDKYKYLPCCLESNQNKPGRPRYIYEHPEASDEQEKKGRQADKTLLTSDKALKKGFNGILPELITKFLNTLNPDAFPIRGTFPTFFRTGSLWGNNSVLDAIISGLMAYYNDLTETEQIEYKKRTVNRFPLLSDMFKYNKMDDTKKYDYLKKLRQQFLKFIQSNITSQSTYDMENNILLEYLNNDNTYLDIKLFWRILEELFDIDIYLFQRDSLNPSGTVGTPQYLQEYLRYKKDKNISRLSILLFETIGAEFDRLEYPQIELITNNVDSTQNIINPIPYFSTEFAKDKIFLPRLQKTFQQIFSYNGRNNLPFTNPFISKPNAQCVDFYGKVRLLQFPELIIITEPIPPLDQSEMVNIKNQCSYDPVELKTAISFLNYEGVTDIKQIKLDGNIIGLECIKKININGVKEFIQFYIPIKTINIEVDYPLSTRSTLISPQTNNISVLEQFNKFFKLARFLTEYIVWIFSKWHRSKRGNIFDLDYIKQFALTMIDIVSEHSYPDIIPRRLDDNFSGVTRSGKLLTSNIEIRNKLIYALQNKINQNSTNVVEYYTRKYIKNYYQDITDFNTSNEFIILFGTNMVLNWINTKLPYHILYDRIIPGHERFILMNEQEEPDIEEKNENEEKNKENDDNDSAIDSKLLQKKKAEETMAKTPYFAKFNFLNNRIFIVQPAANIENAIYIGKMWSENEYNPGYSESPVNVQNIGYTLIIYNSPFSTMMYNIGDNSLGIKVLVYKYKEQDYTTAILDF